LEVESTSGGYCHGVDHGRFQGAGGMQNRTNQGHKETIRQAALNPLKRRIVTFILQTNVLSMKKDKSLKDMSVYEASDFWDDHDFTEFGDIQEGKDIQFTFNKRKHFGNEWLSEKVSS